MFLNCRKRLSVNQASQFTIHDFGPPGTEIFIGSCNSQLALFTTERLRELLADGGIFENPFKAQFSVN